jgi:hypothetical protein
MRDHSVAYVAMIRRSRRFELRQQGDRFILNLERIPGEVLRRPSAGWVDCDGDD